MNRLLEMAIYQNIDTILDMLYVKLQATGGMTSIKRVIRTKDTGAIVRAALESLKKIGMLDRFRFQERKSAQKSNQFRKDGNLSYINKDYKAAIDHYNKALAYAPNESTEINLAYSNISAVMLSIKAYKACLLNIEAAKVNCPEFLRDKLEKRIIEAQKHVNEEISRDELICTDEYMLHYAEFDVERNVEIPCVSSDVTVEGKTAVAANVIKAGTMVALERAYVSFQDEIYEYTSCYYCHKMCFFFVPCIGCYKALFCSKQCRQECLEEYHRIECQIADDMYSMESTDINQHLNKLAIRAAVKMSLQLGWEQLRVASLKMGSKLLNESSVAEAFDCNSPVSMLCYDDQMAVPEEVMISRCLVSAATVHWLSLVPDYLPEERAEHEKAKDTLGRILLHLNTTFLKQISIPCSVMDYKSPNRGCVDEALRNIGWFSFSSKLAQSCEPNLHVVGFNNHISLLALQRIKKGEKLTISYIEHFYDMNVLPCPKNSRIRQKLLFKYLETTCRCRVCLQEWHSNSNVLGSLTSLQQEAYDHSRTVMNNGGSFDQRIKATSLALDELTGCFNTTQHRNVYLDLKKTLSDCQGAKYLNETYGCFQTLHPRHDFNDYSN